MKKQIEKDAFYFPHFCNARHDRKIRRVRKELGLEGYGIFFMLLEVLREQADYKYPIEDIDLLADEFGTSEQKVRTVICNYDLFKVDDKEMFFSSGLIVYLQPYLEGKLNKRISGIRGNLIKHKHITKEQSNEMSNTDILEYYNNTFSQCDSLAIASKVNESKVNESKVNESKVNESKHKYGEYKHVLLTDKEYESLKTKVDDVDKWIKILDESIQEKGNIYHIKDFNLAIQKWYKRDNKNNSIPNNNTTTIKTNICKKCGAILTADNTSGLCWKCEE